MKRIRITLGLMLSAALLTVSFGAQAVVGHGIVKVAVDLPAPFCASLGEFVIDSGDVDPIGRLASVVIETVGPRVSRNPLQMWLPGEPIITLSTCDGTGSPALAIATAP